MYNEIFSLNITLKLFKMDIIINMKYKNIFRIIIILYEIHDAWMGRTVVLKYLLVIIRAYTSPLNNA